MDMSLTLAEKVELRRLKEKQEAYEAQQSNKRDAINRLVGGYQGYAILAQWDKLKAIVED